MITRFPNSRPAYGAILQAWLTSGDPDHVAVGENLALDHRIAPTRDADFYQRMNLPSSSSALRDALRRYHQQYVREIPERSFLHPTLNGSNFIGGAAINGISGDLELAVVMSISRLYRPIVTAHSADSSLFPDLPMDAEADIDEQAFGNWLTRHLSGRDTAYVDRFIGNVMHALNEYRASRRHNPVWATTWSRFLLVRDKGPERWTELIGVPRFASEWLIVLKYRVADAGTLVRPTQFEAGWFGYHFPSPPSHPLHLGGAVVDLSDNPTPLAGLTTEYIHEQIDLRPEFWVAAGRLVGHASRAVGGAVEKCRQRHWGVLARSFDSAVLEQWRAGNCHISY